MDILNIEVARITTSARKRPVSPEKVADIQRSIDQQGLLQPIGVRAYGDGYQLVFGAHRLAAFQETGTAEIPALVFPAEMTDDECALAEIQENLARNDLTGAERKAFAAEVGRLIPRLHVDSSDDTDSTMEQKWLLELAEKSGMGKSAMYNWWKAFCAETDRSIAPKQASPEDKDDFFSWLEDAKAKADAEKAERVRKADDERIKREREAFQKKKDADKSGFAERAKLLAEEYGATEVMEWMYQLIHVWKNS